jgi:hypothetical protein
MSVRGAARQALAQTGKVSVRRAFLKGGGTNSLRSVVTFLVARERSFPVSECVFSWTTQYHQTWSHIVVRIRLAPQAGITAQTMATLQATWESAIQNRWSNRWAIGRPGESGIPITFDVQWVTTNEHYVVAVQPGPARSNLGMWDTADTGAAVSHEFGHMLGNPDEYAELPRCPARNPVNSGTIMDNLSGTIPDRLLTRIATDVGSTIVPIP